MASAAPAIAHDEARGSVLRVAAAAFYFFCLLCSYYLLRPLRDEMGVRTGVENLPWLFTGTFVAMLAVVPLFGWAASRLSTSRLLPAVYGFFLANLVLFGFALNHGWKVGVIAPAFFIWVSVFNLCVVSVFWSLMAEVFEEPEARRKFPRIAIGGSVGAISGPSLATFLATRLESAGLIAVSSAFLLLATLTASWLARGVSTRLRGSEQRAGIFDGLTLTLRTPLLRAVSFLVICYTTLSTFLYFQQAEILSATVADSGTRTAYFASIDLAVNDGTIAFQLLGTSTLLVRLGLGITMALVPAIVAAGMAVLGSIPALGVLAAVQVAHRVGNFAVSRPSREILFTVVDQRTRYQAKNFVDTTVYRASDAVSAWAFSALRSLGMAAAGIAWAGAGLAILWLVQAFITGRRHDARTQLER